MLNHGFSAVKKFGDVGVVHTNMGIYHPTPFGPTMMVLYGFIPPINGTYMCLFKHNGC